MGTKLAWGQYQGPQEAKTRGEQQRGEELALVVDMDEARVNEGIGQREDIGADRVEMRESPS